MAQLWCTGPALIYVGVGAAGAPLFLGTSEDPPEIDITPALSPVMNDIKGNVLGFDWQFMGQSAQISLRGGRWQATVFNALDAMPSPSGTDMINPFGDIGTFMIQEGKAFPVWVAFPYSPLNTGGKASMAGMVAGYHFYASWPIYIGKRPGTRAYTSPIVFQAEQVYTAATGQLSLGDHSMSGLPAAS